MRDVLIFVAVLVVAGVFSVSLVALANRSGDKLGDRRYRHLFDRDESGGFVDLDRRGRPVRKDADR